MKLISWNVNGLRAVCRKGFDDFLRRHDPDILCLQEVKATPEQAELPAHPYQVYWNSAERKGYAGTATFTKQEPRSVQRGIGEPADNEGRVLTLEFDDYFVVNCYTPNVRHDLSRLAYRQRWDAAFRAYLKKLERRKPVIACGDFNVAHEEIDLARPRANRGHAGFTDEERAGFSALLAAGFVDTFRLFTSDGGHYSWWSYRGKARERNVGWRIDYVIVSAALRHRVTSAFILPEVYGSDHCPVGITLE